MKKLYPFFILLSLLFTSSGCQKETLADIEQSLVGSWEIRYVSGGLNPVRTSNPGNGNILQFTGTNYTYITRAKVTANKGTYCVGVTGSGRNKEYTLSFADGVINKECSKDTPKVFKIEGDKLTITTVSISLDGTIEIYERVKDPVLETADQSISKLKDALAKANSACGFANPDESLLWLKDIMVKGEEDIETMKHMGNYLGKIYSTSYQNKPVFYIRMAMGSGGLAAYIFDCTGTRVMFSRNDDPIAFSLEAQKGQLIYSNIPL